MLIFGILTVVIVSILTICSVSIVRNTAISKVEHHLIDKATDVTEILDARTNSFYKFMESVSYSSFLGDSTLSYFQKV